MELSPATYDKLRTLIYERTGITLNDGKQALLKSRLTKRLRELELPDFDTYLHKLEQSQHDPEWVHFFDAISTNHTAFFRETAHFNFLINWLREFNQSGKTTLRIWCGASSSGQEPYSLAMLIHSLITHPTIDAKVLATDISTRVLHQATEGIYDERGMSGVSMDKRNRFFTHELINGASHWRVKPELKRYVHYNRLNLTHIPFPMNGPFDLIFLRNVMIYFDDALRQRLINECYRLIRPGGYLFIGSSETLTSIDTKFKPVQAAVYQRDA